MIKEIHIKNFKSISDLIIKTDNKFNIIIGENNIGKTSIFEAVHLWKICYEANVQKRDKNRFYANPRNINFADNEFLRVFEDKDLFNSTLFDKNKDISITIHLNYNGNDYNLGFVITKVKVLDNAYLQVDYVDKGAFTSFSERISNEKSTNLTNVFNICESRPIANIVAKEPYMYKAQIMDKLRRGKGYEVLRNKIIKSNTEVLESHLSNIMGKKYKFSEVDKDNKTYIRLMVNGNNILSQGSGFLQVAEIFSSLEYTSESAVNILLIDEPDSHMHISLQKKLIDELRNIENSQIFIITHNENFINYIPDEEIIYIDQKRKKKGIIEHIKKGYKNLIIKGLSGTIERIDRLRNANTIVLCEGEVDVKFLNKLLERYSVINNLDLPNIYIEQLCGIDTLSDKLLSYSRAYNELTPDDVKWIVLRDSDCLPLSLQSTSAKKCKKYITVDDKKIIFQNGYGVESTFIAESSKLRNLLIRYYCIHEDINNDLDLKIQQLKEEFADEVEKMSSPQYKELKRHFDRQKTKMAEYSNITFEQFLEPIYQKADKVQYILTKKITDMFLVELHKFIVGRIHTTKDSLNHSSIIDYYLENLDSMDIFYDFHVQIIKQILGEH